ncbi:DUF3524 domain-containing protein [Microbulbifer sp. OS29]|uniref:tRNA-queuosine alpha-mannosyltransferase n=1 Tax=Microbulbifer okhotskensis TaxID=2926617 RepID=A0A9X2ESQ3_9GAMM|nr:DUF3524 domain-containing protein [Microbulbifer okhotskensis]MCO1334908.1 DUF3524 domain-containing protein [Microbulbifer okhotskensis]
MNVLLLSAYDADSHKRWRKGLVVAFPEWRWTVLTLPPRYFSWRIRGNSLSWARGELGHTLKQEWDLIIATSMTDLSALRGLVPEIVGVPTVVYFHENQFAYPVSSGATQSVEPQLLNIYTALAGDLLLFNSEYNRHTLISGAKKLLKRFPDCVPQGVCQEIEAKSQVLPVPLENSLFDLPEPDPTFSWGRCTEQGCKGEVSEDTLIISWAARWEYDKGADRLLEILQGLRSRKVKFRINLMGQFFRNSPEEFFRIQREFSGELLVVGYVESIEIYQKILQHSHVFLSTAYHEFQGLAVMEAAVAGATPIVPDEQCYPEFYPKSLRYSSRLDAVDKLESLYLLLQEEGGREKVDFTYISAEQMWSRYMECFSRLTTF